MSRKSIPVLLSTVPRASVFILCAVIFLSGCSAPRGEQDTANQLSFSTTVPPSPSAQAKPASTVTLTQPTPTFASPKVEIPKAPVPIAMPSGTVEAKAVALADAVGPKAANPLAGWLTVYDALGIPVLSANRTPLGTTGDDPIGPAYWRVWYMSGMARPGSGFRLSDFVKAFNVGGGSSFDSAHAGAKLLQDLRAVSSSKDPRVQLFGRFIAEMVRRGSGQTNLLDASVTADQVIISGDVAELISWVVIRNLVFAVAPKTTSLLRAPLSRSGSGTGAVELTIMQRQPLGPVRALVPPAIPLLEQQGCTSLTGEDVTYWLNWALNKVIGGGVRLPGMTEATKGLVEYVQDKRGALTSTIEKTKSLTGLVNSVASVLSLAMQIHALTVDTNMEPMPLVRTRTTTDGNRATLDIALRYDPGRFPDGNQKAACISSFLLNAFGIGFTLPGAQRLPGVELTVSEGQGFGQLVLWGDFRQRRQDTNENGEAQVLILGKRQKRTLPQSVRPVAKEFSVIISAQPEAMTANSIANMFFDSLTFWVEPGASGLVNAGVDIAKAFHYEVGEIVLPLTDWSTAYRVDQVLGDGAHVTGTICSLTEPFKLNDEFPGNGAWVLSFAPSSEKGGNVTVEGSVFDAAQSGRGGYTVSGIPDKPVLHIASMEISTADVGSGPSGAADFTLEPLDADADCASK